jgi:hypothetical protein
LEIKGRQIEKKNEKNVVANEKNVVANEKNVVPRRFAMPLGPNFAAQKMSKRRNGMAKRFRGPPSRFRAG